MYRCSQCLFTSHLEKLFKGHLIIHGEKKFKCTKCSYKTYSKQYLNKHLETHRAKLQVQCEYCSYKGSEGRLSRHYNRKHRWAEKRKCELCHYESYYERELKTHVETNHGKKPFKCEECSLGFKWLSLLQRHMVNMHNYKTHIAEISKFKCDQCKFTTSSPVLLKLHIKNHILERDRELTCDECDYKTIYVSEFKTHVRNHKAPKLFKCKKPVACNEFSLKCKSFSNLRRQKLIHTDEKSYKCHLCEYRCGKKGTLKTHVMWHLEERINRTEQVRSIKQLYKIQWTIPEKKIILFCFHYSKLEKWGRQKKKMFKERLERSTLSQEKLNETTIEKLYSIVAQIHKYIPQDEIENIRTEALMEAEADYENLAEEDKKMIRTEHWIQEEKWTLLWTMKYAQTKHKRQTDSSAEWKRIFFHHYPEKKNYDNVKLTSQRSNFIKYKVFTREQLEHMDVCIETMIRERTCPIQHPIPLI